MLNLLTMEKFWKNVCRIRLNLFLLNITLKSSQNDLFLNCKHNMHASVEQQSIGRVQSSSTTHTCTHDITLTHLRMGPLLPQGAARCVRRSCVAFWCGQHGRGAHKRVHQHAHGRRKCEFQLKWGRRHGRPPPTLVFVLAPITPVEVSNCWSGQTTVSWTHTITNNLRFYRPFRRRSLHVFPCLQVSPLQTER